MHIVLRDPQRGRWLAFDNPTAIVEVHDAADVMPALRDIERRIATDNLWAAGFVSYEAAAGFDPAYVTLPKGSLPLLSFGLYARMETLADLNAGSEGPRVLADWRLDTAQDAYMKNVERIRQEIAAGNTYQVNYTMRGVARAVADPWQLFLDIARDAPLAAYLQNADHAIVSASPELFFRLSGNTLVSRPMKGTALRGLSAAEDVLQRRVLAESAKDRAENVMIADMVRNDMGRIAEPGTVVAETMFDIEKYPTVWQATSTIKASTHAPIADIFAAMFPCASITGAPKVASMQFIADLERTPRGVYTGAIGYMAPGREAQFNVAIRTACVDRQSATAEYGVGGGIIWDSQPAAEYAECLAKGRILKQRLPPAEFQLIETLLWTQESGYFLLDGHLTRLAASADYFDFHYSQGEVGNALQDFARTLQGKQHRVRLLFSSNGDAALSETPVPTAQNSSPVRLRLARHPVNARDVFLYHKTTHRDVYTAAIQGVADCDDVLLWNEDGLLTESTIANIAVRVDGTFYTPPVTCGLLAGVMRESLLKTGALRERRISIDELAHAEEIVLFNSVRQTYGAKLL